MELGEVLYYNNVDTLTCEIHHHLIFAIGRTETLMHGNHERKYYPLRSHGQLKVLKNK